MSAPSLSASTDEAPIALLDFDQWLNGNNADRMIFAYTVRAEFKRTGFFRRTNHGIPEPQFLRTRELMKKFFVDLPLEHRMRYHFPDLKGQLGYTPLGVEKALGAKKPDNKHFLMSGDYNAMPEISEVPGLREANNALFEAYNKLYAQFMEVVAMSLDLPSDYFAQSLGNSSLRLIHYLLHDNAIEPDDEASLSVDRGGDVLGKCNEPHTDIDWLTLLHSAQPGLQLRYGNRWLPIPCSFDSLVVNVGDMLEHLTAGTYVSGAHRVVCPPGNHRFSMPFFGHTHPQTSIVPLSQFRPSCGKKFPHATEGEYLEKRLAEIGFRAGEGKN